MQRIFFLLVVLAFMAVSSGCASINPKAATLEAAAEIKDPFEYLQKISSFHSETADYYFYKDTSYRVLDTPFGVYSFYSLEERGVGISGIWPARRIIKRPEYYSIKLSQFDIESLRVRKILSTDPLFPFVGYLCEQSLLEIKKWNADPSNSTYPLGIGSKYLWQFEYKGSNYILYTSYTLGKDSGYLILKPQAAKKYLDSYYRTYDKIFDEQLAKMRKLMLTGQGNIFQMSKILQIFENALGKKATIVGMISSKLIGDGICESEAMVQEGFGKQSVRMMLRTSISKDGTPQAYERFRMQ